MKSEEIRAVEMTRRIRDEIYEETKSLSDDDLIQYFKRKAGTDRATRPGSNERESQRSRK